MTQPGLRPPTHAGEMLLEEFLRPRGLTQVEAANRMGIPANRLDELVKGKRGVTAATALKLSRLLDTTPEFWMNLQSAWELWHARQHERQAS